MIKVYKLYLRQDSSKIPFYIGITGNSLKWRLKGHYRDLLNPKLKSYKISKLRSLKKANVDVDIELLKEFNTYEDAFLFEIETISRYRQLNIKLCNTTIGGEGYVLYKVKMYDKSGNLLKIYNSCQEAADDNNCPENCISKICNGKQYFLRKSLIFRKEEDTFDKYPTSIPRKNLNIESRNKLKSTISVSRKYKNNKEPRLVYQTDLDNNLIRIWNSCEDCSKHFNVAITSIRRVLNKIRPKYKNFKFYYKNEFEDLSR